MGRALLRNCSNIEPLDLRGSELDTFDGRTGKQWRESVVAYLQFRSGNAWRRMSTMEARSDPERWIYMDAIRLVDGCVREETRREELRQPSLLPAKTPVQMQSWRLSYIPRTILVARLMAIDPTLTDKKLISRFTSAKLSTMLAERGGDISAPVKIDRRRRA